MPSLNKCSVLGCSNTPSQMHVGDTRLKTNSFFKFPSKPELAAEWETLCGQPKPIRPLEQARICIAHFQKENYGDTTLNKTKRPLKSKIKRLKTDCLPTLHLPSAKVIARAKHLPTKKFAKSKVQVVPELSVKKSTICQVNSRSVDANGSTAGSASASFVASPKNDNCFLPDFSGDASPIEIVSASPNLSAATDIQVKNLKNKVEDFELQLLKEKEKCKKLKEQLKEKDANISGLNRQVLGLLLTPNQMDVFFKLNPRPKWTAEEIAKAATARHYSKRCFKFITKVLKIPLPSIRDRQLKKLVQKTDLRPDIILNMMEYMKESGAQNFEINAREVDGILIKQFK